MILGFIGLGKMGSAMVERLLEQKHEVVVYDLHADAVQNAMQQGARGASSLEELVKALSTPRVIWVMVPHGEPTNAVLNELQSHLSAGDIVIDGGNSPYQETVKQAEAFAKKGVTLLDAGTSGGFEGARHGACLMVGGDEEAVKKARPVFESLATEGGFAHVGPSGAGHYTKMVHNAVEYALLQAYGEGFALLQSATYQFDLAQIADNWNHGSVVRSWLCELAEQAFRQDPELKLIADDVGGGSTGEWAVSESMRAAVPLPSIYLALASRYASRKDESFAAKFVAVLRQQFGGHGVEKK